MPKRRFGTLIDTQSSYFDTRFVGYICGHHARKVVRQYLHDNGVSVWFLGDHQGVRAYWPRVQETAWVPVVYAGQYLCDDEI